jgi:hypothetical protein
MLTHRLVPHHLVPHHWIMNRSTYILKYLIFCLLFMFTACQDNTKNMKNSSTNIEKTAKTTPKIDRQSLVNRINQLELPQKIYTKDLLTLNVQLSTNLELPNLTKKPNISPKNSSLKYPIELLIKPQGCKDLSVCHQNGKCTSLHTVAKKKVITHDSSTIKQCISIKRSSCLSSLICHMKGACTPIAGRCQVKSNLDCQQSDLCKRYGLCQAKAQRCIASETYSCQKSMACKTLGACYLKVDKCVTQRELQTKCQVGCMNIANECICSTHAQQISKLKIKIDPACIMECEKEGRCRLGKQGCKARSTRMCAQSELCTISGRCALYKGECVASMLSCKHSIACELLGACYMESDRCIIRDQVDCERSLACKDLGYCKFQEGSDNQRNSCLKTKPTINCQKKCRLNGLCAIKNQRCVALSNKSCRTSEACKKYGRCSLSKQGCIVKRNQDCERSLECTLFGRCKAYQEKCIK